MTVRIGVVSLDNLREAAWMLLFRHTMVRAQRVAATYPLPSALGRAWPVKRRPDSFAMEFSAVHWNSAQTTLTWTWHAAGSAALAGELTWPGAYEAGDDHASNLLTVAEASLVERCSNGRPPALAAKPTVLDGSVDAELLAEHAVDLQSARERWMAMPSCR
jgi:hypothetical protein